MKLRPRYLLILRKRFCFLNKIISARAGKAPCARLSRTEPTSALRHSASIPCACLLTRDETAANALMQPIHDRMPVIFAPEDWDA